MEKRGVIEPGRTPPDRPGDAAGAAKAAALTGHKAATPLEAHPTRRVEDAARAAIERSRRGG